MKLNELARSIWQNMQAFAVALDDDYLTALETRVKRLEIAGRSREAELFALSARVQALSERVDRSASS